MEAGVAARCLIVGLAFAAGFLLARYSSVMREKRMSMELSADWQGQKRGYLAWRLRRGFEITLPFARVLLGIGCVRRTVDRAVLFLADAGYASSRETALSVAAVGLAVVVLGGYALSGELACGCALAVCAVMGTVGWMRIRAEKRRALLQEHVPDALRAMSACFGAGLSLMQTLQQLAQSSPDSLKPLFGRSARALEAGSTTREALSFLEDPDIPELTFVSLALDVQHQTGGSLAALLESSCMAVEGELELQRSLRVQTAQAKLSARIVTVMPFALVALFSLVSEDFLEPFFASMEGGALLGLALVLQLMGVLSIRRVLHAEAKS